MDHNEFKKLFLPFTNIMYKTSLNILGNHDDAMDVVQDTFLTLWGIKDELKGIKNINAFTTKMVKNKCIDKIRKNKKKLSNYENCKNLDNILFSESTEEQIIALEGKQKIVNWINFQKEPNRTVFLLRHINELSFNEISERTKLSEGNIRVIISRMRKELKNYLANENKQ
ncbi:MAG: RNA polymerase sigma factor [Bacteroidales bacterium]|jgi:RNA polymerase sigma-70 factor (ECF subfamily)